MPFVQTAMIDASGAARPKGSKGENINHYTGIRMRVVGSGSLEMTLRSQDNVRNVSLIPFTMASIARTSPFRLVNFVEQRVQLKIETLLIDETFRINRIILYAKPLWVEEPG